MEKLDGSLDDLLEAIPAIPVVLKYSILKDVAKGLLYLHKRNPSIIHHDLTARNVLLTTSLEAKITDVGHSNLVNVLPDFTILSTVYFPPAGHVHDSTNSTSVDVFSFGHLILFTLTQVCMKNK